MVEMRIGYGPDVEVWYRYVDIARENGGVEIRLREFPVVKTTPHGVWILDGGRRWVKRDARKRYACPTKEEALTSFMARKRRQRRILKGQLRRVELAIAQAGGYDRHTITAMGLFGVDPEAVTPEQRRAAKSINFRHLYSMPHQMTVGGHARQTAIPLGLETSFEDVEARIMAHLHDDTESRLRRMMGYMRSLGWDFVPISDTEWGYVKFESGRGIAKEGDDTWREDWKDAQHENRE